MVSSSVFYLISGKFLPLADSFHSGPIPIDKDTKHYFPKCIVWISVTFLYIPTTP